ncbi:TonB-dependent receptor [Marinobacter xestospongiae]|uniref:TonB-dependent receptor n=1 Tax=Marinobacter xestospongiae TaxID=994319 RepID=A0ABU3VYM2_9GAMM|nr:TonB-dependent receptor [Marinobacter xestospongiae]MDV2079402.1 TonB-dependent receptor [Marinobacter xestospongiae]
MPQLVPAKPCLAAEKPRFPILVLGLGLCSVQVAWADRAPSADHALPPIVVTGEKVERSIYDTSSSVEVYDQQRIESTPGATELSDVLDLNPAIVDPGIGNHMPAVRGVDGSGSSIGGLATFAGVRPRLNVSLDGRSLSYSEMAFGPRSLWDMRQVETYVGPQSHIQGRNALAGAVVMKSNNPSFQWEGAVKGAVGNQGYAQTAALVSGPIVEDELAFRLSVDRQQRESYVDLATYEPVGDAREVESTAARFKLQYEPAALPDFGTTLTVSDMDTRAPQAEYELSNPPSRQANEFRPVYTTDSTSASWDMVWDLGRQMRFENNMTFSKLEFERRTQNTSANFTSDGDEFQIEPLLHFGADGESVRGLVGVRLYDFDADEAFINAVGNQPMKDETQTRSAFGELTYPLATTVDLTFGLRYEWERRQRTALVQLNPVFGVDLDFDETYNVLLPRLDLAWKPRAGQTFGMKVAKGYNAGGAGLSITNFQPYEYDEETVINYEVYARNALLDGELELTANVFYNDYSDMQLPEYVGADDIIIRNADKAISYGAELGSRWMPAPAFALTGSLALLKTDVEDFDGTVIEGNELPRAPAYAATLGAVYEPLDNLELSGNVRYSDSYYADYDNLPAEKIEGYTVANVQLAYTYGPAHMTVFVNNLFDTDAETMIFNSLVDNPLRVQPRLAGASFEYRF